MHRFFVVVCYLSCLCFDSKNLKRARHFLFVMNSNGIISVKHEVGHRDVPIGGANEMGRRQTTKKYEHFRFKWTNKTINFFKAIPEFGLCVCEIVFACTSSTLGFSNITMRHQPREEKICHQVVLFIVLCMIFVCVCVSLLGCDAIFH